MLTIKNTNKIVNQQINAEWYVEEIREMNTHYIQTQKIQHLYLITIRNRSNKYFEYVKLYRVKDKGAKWYELKCTRKGNVYTELLSIKGIENIKALIQHIKIVGID